MKIFIGSDHRGFAMKQQLVDWLKSQGHEVVDCGNDHLDPLDDYVDFAKKVASSVIPAKAGIYTDGSPIESGMTSYEKTSLGIVLCGSGIGVTVTANRFTGIICGLGLTPEQVRQAREDDHMNILALATNYTDIETAKLMIKAFFDAIPRTEEKYLRRIRKIDEAD